MEARDKKRVKARADWEAEKKKFAAKEVATMATAVVYAKSVRHITPQRVPQTETMLAQICTATSTPQNNTDRPGTYICKLCCEYNGVDVIEDHAQANCKHRNVPCYNARYLGTWEDHVGFNTSN